MARQFLKRERLYGAKLNIVLSDDDYLASLNQAYLQKEGPTDVLSFPLVELEELEHYRKSTEEFMLGEIYISWDRVLGQARQREISPQQELKRLVVHGLFHLVGYDHQDSNQEVYMRLQERKFMREMQYRFLRQRGSHEKLI